MFADQQCPCPVERAIRKRKSSFSCPSIKRLKQRTIEDLPNELFYQIFSYLTDDEIFHSFAQMKGSDRLEQLIRNRRSIDLRDIRQNLFKTYRSSINTQCIREIRLFNDDQTPAIINAFFAPYEFDLSNSFPNLINLVLDQPEQNDLINLMKSFAQLEHLSIRCSTLVRMCSVVYTNLYQSIARSDRLKSLTILDDPDELITLPRDLHFPCLKHLTLGLLTKFDLKNILQSAPQLKSFKCSLYLDQSNEPIDWNVPSNLIQLELDSPRAEFPLIEQILRSMSKLERLTLICRGSEARVWECFIRENLPNLTDFRFKFDIRQRTILPTDYQTSWWSNEKQWIVVHHPLSPFIYTIPFIEKKLVLNTRTAFRQEDYSALKICNEYSNIRQLIVTLNPLGFKLCRNEEIYFPQVESLTLIDYKNSQKPIAHLKTLVNLSSVRHLTLDHRMRSTTFLLLIKEMPNLTSLSGQDATFYSITRKFQNGKVLSYFQSKIKSLSISPLNACNDLRYVSQLCIAFSHIEHIILTIKSANQIWPWLNKLTQLRSATVFCRYGSFTDLIDHKWFFNVYYELRSRQDLRLWIR